MWFKVVFNKDGSIASCDEASTSRESGRQVFYVEAETRAGAVAVARDKWRKLALNKAAGIAAGGCRVCAKPIDTNGRRCARCRANQRAARQRFVERQRNGQMHTEESRRRAQSENGRANLLKAQLVAQEITKTPIESHAWSRRLYAVRVLREVDEALAEAGSIQEFRTWLKERIESVLVGQPVAAE